MLRKLICLVSFILVLGMALASGAKAADPNLVGWWLLNEGAGDIAVDASGSGNDGTINNLNGGLGADGSVWVDDPVRGMVISFNGTADGAFVRAGDIPQMTLTNEFTWSFWASHSEENTADNDIILGNRMDENAVDFVPRQFIKFTPTKFEWHMNGNGDDNLDYDDIPADVWIHHAVVKTADQLTYYRNGVEASSGTFTQPMDFPQPLYFGGDNEGAEGENWSGLMSDVRIYNRALTELEIVAAMEDVERVDMKIGFAILPPVIDGEADEIWAGASTQNFVPLEDPANASGSWQVLYDSENLYVIVDMTDDSLQNDSDGAWQDDSIEVYFDGGNTKLDTPLSGDDHQYTFAWATDEIQGTNADGYTEGIELAQVDTDTGWRIEIKMPWLSIQEAAPQAGDLIGIDCYYNDDDDGGDSRENKLLSFSAIEGWNDASQWGTAVLAADKRVDVTAPGDVVQGVPNDGLMDGDNFGWPGAETPDLAIDDDAGTKFLHFKGELEPTGIQIEPAFGASVVTGLTFTTANDASERDPISFELSGSNDSIDGPYTLIASGDIVDFAMEIEWPRFTMNATPIAFENDAAYKYYQVMFPALRDAASANSMQIAEVELLGVPAKIILVSGIHDFDEDGVVDDFMLLDLLKAEGYTVDYQPGNWTELDDAKIAALNAAGLVIISRTTSSGDYTADDTETAQWNSITTPMIVSSTHVVRSSKWKLLDSESLLNLAPAMMDLADGSQVDAMDEAVGLSSFIDAAPGNGTVLATGDGLPWIIEWEAGVEYYDGAGQTAGGTRVFFVAGTQELVDVSNWGEWNLTPDGEAIYLDTVDRLIAPPAPDEVVNLLSVE